MSALPPLNAVEKCPACARPARGYIYQYPASTHFCASACGQKPPDPHMHRTCAGCGYTWMEACETPIPSPYTTAGKPPAPPPLPPDWSAPDTHVEIPEFKTPRWVRLLFIVIVAIVFWLVIRAAG